MIRWLNDACAMFLCWLLIRDALRYSEGESKPEELKP